MDKASFDDSGDPGLGSDIAHSEIYLYSFDFCGISQLCFCAAESILRKKGLPIWVVIIVNLLVIAVLMTASILILSEAASSLIVGFPRYQKISSCACNIGCNALKSRR